MEIRAYEADIDFTSALSLYASVGWTAYTTNPEKLRLGLLNSSLVLLAIGDTGIIGLIRCISDGQTICYIQDILVDPSNQGHGIGKGLVEKVLHHYSCVRQVVLMTDSEPGQKRFYESVGFQEIKGDLSGFVLIRP